MTAMTEDFMPLGRQLFRRGIASALAELLVQKHSTAKQIARAYGIDPATAENLRKGSLSVGTLQKVIAVEGRGLWERLGDEVCGQTHEEYLEQLVGEIERAAEREAARRERVRELEARASAFGPL